MSKTIYILRSVSGAGKSTLAKELCKEGIADIHLEADMYFMDYAKKEYNFDASKLGVAHEWCKRKSEEAMSLGYDLVVSNTFTTEKEIQPYLDLAEQYGYKVVSLIVENRS